MKTSFLAVVAFIIFSAMAWASDSGTVRDGSGNLRETWRQQGSRIEVRDGSGNLIRQISPSNSSSNNRFDIRDGSGNRVGEFERHQD